MTSDQFAWNTEPGQRFAFLSAYWNVTEAKILIRDRPRRLHQLPVAPLSGLLEMIDLEAGKVDTADTEVPVIVIRVGRGWLPIDGWHRLARALRDGKEWVWAARLTQKEEKSVRLS